ncbi:hypothetical protein [Candidatus Poriferisocius sp.]|uniref:hypothetical protein n=1 Tax=Candidatus Poriferisocius sp. TaxID=3101276 RepID=UPI003B5B617B
MAAPQQRPRPAPSPPQPAEQPRRHLRAAPRPRRRLMPILGWAAAVTVVIALFALALFHAVIVDRQTTLDGLNEQLDDARAVNDRLRLNVARAEAPDRIVAEALYRLGMVEPDQRVYLVPVELEEGGAR